MSTLLDLAYAYLLVGAMLALAFALALVVLPFPGPRPVCALWRLWLRHGTAGALALIVLGWLPMAGRAYFVWRGSILAGERTSRSEETR